MNYVTLYRNDPHLRIFFNDIKHKFLKQIELLPQRENDELYERLFYYFGEVRNNTTARLTVSVDDIGVSVDLTATDSMNYRIDILSTGVSLNDYNFSFSGDYSEKKKKQLAMSMVVMDLIIRVCPSIIPLRRFYIFKNDDSYTNGAFSCEKKMIVYNVGEPDTSYKL